MVTNIKKTFSLFFWLFYLNYLDLNSIAFAAAQPVITGGIINKVDIVKIPLPEQQILTTRLLTINNKLQTELNLPAQTAANQSRFNGGFIEREKSKP